MIPSKDQQRVVESPLHSLRIVAGAGTGKTTTVAMRVDALVRHHGLEPEEILGITFTNKAAEELSDRIRATIGPLVGTGREVEIHTYHGFASQLLHEFGALVGIERSASLMTPTLSRQLLGSLMVERDLLHFDPTLRASVEKLRALGSAVSDNLLSPIQVIAAAGSEDPWAERVEMLEILQRYEEEKRRLGVVDFADLISAAHRLVVGHPEVAESIRGRTRAVLLDEYQDTNPAQRELLRTLFANHTPVLAVGDEDQTIYEWRGASLQNFRAFPEHFPHDGRPARTLHLSENRRSGAAILAVANRVRAEIDDAPRQALVPLENAPDALVTSSWFGTVTDEAAAIADRIIELAESGHRWRDVGILFRKNKDMKLVHDALSKRGIPFEVANVGGLLTIPEVADLHAWLRILADPEDGTAFARITVGSRFRLGLSDLNHLARWIRRRRRAEPDDDLPGYTLLEAVDALEEIDGLRPDASEALLQFREEYRDLLTEAQGQSLVELARSVLDRTGAWSDIAAMEPAAGLSARLNLYRFLDLTERWAPLEGRPSLSAFLTYLSELEDDTTEELDTARLSEEDAVTLVTVHRAKGLEWPVVFLPCLYHNNFPSTGRHDNPLAYAQFLPYELRLDREAAPPVDAGMTDAKLRSALSEHNARQEWRIAYVAVTRAMRELHASGAFWNGAPLPNKNPTKPSRLLELIRDNAVDGSWAAEAPERPEVLGSATESAPAPDPLFTGSWPAALRAALADPSWPAEEASERGLRPSYDAAVDEMQQALFELPEPLPAEGVETLSVSTTGLVTYATCPKRYYWSEVDRLPRRSSAAARRGIDVHRRIELHNLGVMPLDEASDYDLLADDQVRSGTRPFETYLGSRFASQKPLMVEAPFELRAGKAWVRGRIDAIYAEEGHWEVVDFKSGRASSDTNRLVQLQVYALAVNEVSFGVPSPESTTVTFAFLGDGLEETSHEVDGEWLRAAGERVGELIAGIASDVWEPRPSEACSQCDFLRHCEPGKERVG